MIIDNLRHADLYKSVSKHIHHAFAFLTRADLLTLDAGRYELAGDDAFALVQDYTTKPAELAKWESHRTYIDVQFIASGVERMGYAHVDTMQVTKDYDTAADYLLYTGTGVDLIMTPGTFAILFPHDVHRPTACVTDPVAVRKIVVKVRAD